MPLASALSEIAACEKGSMSLAVTEEAPASAAETATSPLPAPRSSTDRPATTPGSSSTWRASACPPGQAAAQNGGSVGAVPHSSSIACQSATTSPATCRVTSGTREGRSGRVCRRTKSAETDGAGTDGSAGTHPVNLADDRVPPRCQAPGRCVDPAENWPPGRKPRASLTPTIGRLPPLL